MNLNAEYVRSNGKRIHLGRFDSLDDAAAAVKCARSELGFSKRHGTDRAYDNESQSNEENGNA